MSHVPFRGHASQRLNKEEKVEGAAVYLAGYFKLLRGIGLRLTGVLLCPEDRLPDTFKLDFVLAVPSGNSLGSWIFESDALPH